MVAVHSMRYAAHPHTTVNTINKKTDTPTVRWVKRTGVLWFLPKNACGFCPCTLFAFLHMLHITHIMAFERIIVHSRLHSAFSAFGGQLHFICICIFCIRWATAFLLHFCILWATAFEITCPEDAGAGDVMTIVDGDGDKKWNILSFCLASDASG